MFDAAMTDQPRLNTQHLTLQTVLEGFVRVLQGRNRSEGDDC
jgi:hypothetical protein